jgi:hypothetical protein
MQRAGVVFIAALALAFLGGSIAVAQNDWQFPDPYFGILEIEKSRSHAGAARMQVEPRRPPDIGGGAAPRQPWARRRLWRPAAASTRPAPKSGAGGQR